MVHALSRPWERTNGSSRVKHSWCGSRGSASTSQKARSDFLFPDHVSKLQPLPPEIHSNLKVCHPSITTLRHVICWSYVSSQPSRARISLCHLCQTHYLFPFPPLPTWLCTSSCPRHQHLCNRFLRKPHCIRLVVSKYLLLPDRTGERGGKERIYLCGNKPFPAGLMAFDITSAKELRGQMLYHPFKKSFSSVKKWLWGL